MKIRQRNIFTTIRAEGSILPADLLQRVNDRDPQLKGLSPDDYHLVGNVRLNEAINQSWNRLLGAWAVFQNALKALPATDAGTTLTREKWLLPLFSELGYGRLPTAKAIEIDGKSYPVSHVWQQTPIHLVSAKLKLDERRAGVAGAARVSPHSMTQELLNRSEAHLWGFVSNGLQLRVLRDNRSLTRQAYVEFDLDAMMNGELYADFTMLWLVCHQSRVEIREGERPESCWLEEWSKAAHEQGTRALEVLRVGVEEAIKALGRGFLAHPANQVLLGRLREGKLDRQDYYRQLLRLVYRLLFLFVAEDRELLFAPTADDKARERYTRFYSVSRLRRLAERRLGTRHSDLYHGLKLVMETLSSEGCPELGLPALGGFLFSKEAIPDLDECEIANNDLLDAIRALAFINDGHGRRTVDYKNLRSEELGSVYEALLELHPEVNAEARQFKLETASGNERKTTGSYYTPDSLVQCLLDSALDPVLDEAARQPDPEAAILKLKVVDPACGSGHFLVAAAHRIAKRLAYVRASDGEPTPEATRKALRDVIGHCIYGVDLNPMAVELCKVSLWMETLELGKPLSFLDHHIQVGNSLIGATPALMAKGIPDEAFKPIEGDDKAVCAEYRRKNKNFREKRQSSLPFESGVTLGQMAENLREIGEIDDSTIESVRHKERRYKELLNSPNYLRERLLADAWCAAFVWKKVKDLNHPEPITEELFREIEQSPNEQDPSRILKTPHGKEIGRLAEQYQFFHWHLAFPDVFILDTDTLGTRASSARSDAGWKPAPPGWNGGFDVVLGNPPWERIKLQEKEWFARRRPDIANAQNAAARKRMIEDLAETDEALYAAFKDDIRKAEGESHFVRTSNRYPLCGRGDINTYAIFAETNRMLMSERGRVGCIVPSGVASDDTTKFFFQDLIESNALASLYDFENRDAIFPGVHRSYKFCLLTLVGRERAARSGAEFVFFAHKVEDLSEPQRRFKLSAEDIALLNPNTRTCPIFRTRRDAELTKAIYRRVPVLIQEGQPDGNPWGVSFMRLLDMANDSHLFRTREQLAGEGWQLEGNTFSKDGEEMLPLYEAKMLHHFDHRWASYDGLETVDVTTQQKADPSFVARPRYWVPREEVIYKITRVPADVVKAYRAGENEDLMDAARGWLGRYELAAMSDDELRKRASTKQWQQLIEQREAARQAMAEAPLSEGEAFKLRHSVELRRDVAELIEAKAPRWLMGWRDITNSTNERTVIASVLPRAGVGHTSPLMFTQQDTTHVTCLQANLTALVFDFVARQKIGGTHLTYGYLNQLPVLPPSTYAQPCAWSPSETLREWLAPRVLELSYTARDLRGFAEDCGYAGEPFRWDEARRFLLRVELDAAYFHLYGIEREDVDYILDTFPIVRRKDEAAHGRYRTKECILEVYDAMRAAQASGRPYRTRLDPPPANGWTPPASRQEEASLTSESNKRSAIEGKVDLFARQTEDPQRHFDFGDLE